MASFLIHYVVGIELVKKMELKYGVKLDHFSYNDFILGNLIADSISNSLLKQQKKDDNYENKNVKMYTHFRNKNDLDLCVQIPQLDIFIKKYKQLLETNYSVLGYLFHLYTDVLFFEYLFKLSFKFIDKEMNETKFFSKLKYVKILKSGRLYTYDEFFSSNSRCGIYNDYTVMNKLILEKYKICFNLNELKSGAKHFINPGIREVKYEDIFNILNQINEFIFNSYLSSSSILYVFKESDIYNFLSYVPDCFLEEYNDIVINLLNSGVNKKKIKN